jgi:hypothetical protein
MVRIVSNTLFCSLGPDDLTLGTLIPENTKIIPTVTDNLFEQGTIGQKLVAMSFEPTTSLLVGNGEMTFGGVDPTKFTGEITYVYVCAATSLGISVLILSCAVLEQMFTLPPRFGVSTRLSNTVMVTGQLPTLTPPLASSTLEPPFSASLQVSYFLTLTHTQ